MDPATAHIGAELRVVAHLDKNLLGLTGIVESATKDKVILNFETLGGDRTTKRELSWSAVQLASIPWNQSRAMVSKVDDPHLLDAFNEGAGVAVSTPLTPTPQERAQGLQKRSIQDSISYLLREAHVPEDEIDMTAVAIMSRFSLWLRDESKKLDTAMGATLNATATVLLQQINS